MKHYLLYGGMGAIVGGILSGILAPKFIGWYFEPPVDIGVNCRAATEWAMTHLQWAQIVGIVCGTILSLIISNRHRTG